MRIVSMSSAGELLRRQESGPQVLEIERPQAQPPRRFVVIMLNDDYTPMDFVVRMLMTHFNMDADRANTVMLSIHTSGRASCGVFTKDMAQTRVAAVHEQADAQGYPLRCIIEPADIQGPGQGPGHGQEGGEY